MKGIILQTGILLTLFGGIYFFHQKKSFYKKAQILYFNAEVERLEFLNYNIKKSWFSKSSSEYRQLKEIEPIYKELLIDPDNNYNSDIHRSLIQKFKLDNQYDAGFIPNTYKVLKILENIYQEIPYQKYPEYKLLINDVQSVSQDSLMVNFSLFVCEFQQAHDRYFKFYYDNKEIQFARENVHKGDLQKYYAEYLNPITGMKVRYEK